MSVTKWKRFSIVEVARSHVFVHKKIDAQSSLSDKRGNFDLLECPDWGNIIALTEDNEVILVQQYRHGTDEVTLELPGGAINKNEDPAVGIVRELREETGYDCKELVKIGQVDVNPAFMSNRCHFYVAYGCKKVGVQELDPFEEIDVVLIPITDIKELLKTSKINHSLVVAAFDLYFTLGHDSDC